MALRFAASARNAAAAWALAAAIAPAVGAEPEYLYSCHGYISGPEGAGGMLTLAKSFVEDGTVLGMSVSWSDHSGAAVRKSAANDSAIVGLDWPGPFQSSDGKTPFDWSRSMIRIYYNGAARNRFVFRKDELWHQVIVDRDESLRLFEGGDGSRMMFPGSSGLQLMGEPTTKAAPGMMGTSLDRLLAWGAGARRVTVYETRILRRRRTNRGDWPYPLRRVIASYDLDVAALQRSAVAVRAATEAWEASIADFRRACRREPKVSENDIIVT